MKIRNRYYVLRFPDDDGGTGAAPSPSPAPAPSPSPSATPTAAPNPSPAPAPSPSPAPNLASAPTPADPPKPAATEYPADWRERMAGDDEKALKQLQRYGSPDEVWKKAKALESRLSSGELKSVLGKNATEEEVKAWRTENGIPESHDKYDYTALKIADHEKTIIEPLLKEAHATNQTPEQVQATLRGYNAIKAELAARQQANDAKAQAEGEETLRSDWGGEFKRDINLIHGLLDKIGGSGLKEQLLGGRLADGTPIGSSPAALKALLGLALVDNPAGTVVPNTGGNMEQSVDTEIAAIETIMRTKRDTYNKDEKMQQRYRDLIDVREKFKNRK